MHSPDTEFISNPTIHSFMETYQWCSMPSKELLPVIISSMATNSKMKVMGNVMDNSVTHNTQGIRRFF